MTQKCRPYDRNYHIQNTKSFERYIQLLQYTSDLCQNSSKHHGGSVLVSLGYEVTIIDLQSSPSLYTCLSKLACGTTFYITGGVLMEKFNFWFLLSCSMILACPCTVVIPNFDDVIVVGLFVALSGFFYGIVICGESQLARSSFYSPQFT